MTQTLKPMSLHNPQNYIECASACQSKCSMQERKGKGRRRQEKQKPCQATEILEKAGVDK